MAGRKRGKKVFLKDKELIIGGLLLAVIALYLFVIKPELKNRNYIDGIPAGVYEFLNREDIAALEGSDFPVYRGSEAPKLEGKFRLNSLKIKFDKRNAQPAGRSLDPYVYTFSDQKDDGTIQVDLLSEVPQNDTGKAENSYVSGSNNCFTIYMDQKGISKNCSYQMPALLSGCLSDAGIQNPQEIFIMKTKSCDDTVLMPVGNIRINIEQDGLGESLSKSPTVTEPPTPSALQ